MLERNFQSQLIRDLRTKFPDAIIAKMDANYIQGIPDLIILFSNGRWASLEDKRSSNAPHRPNQDYYVNRMNAMSYSRFIHPGNKEAILHELEQTFRS